MNISIEHILRTRSLSVFISLKVRRYLSGRADNCLPHAYKYEDWIEEWEDSQIKGKDEKYHFYVGEIDIALEKIRARVTEHATDRDSEYRRATAKEVLECLSSVEASEWSEFSDDWIIVAQLLLKNYLADMDFSHESVGKFVRATMSGDSETWRRIHRRWADEERVQ